ncbi:1fbbef25-f6ec-472a-97bc-7fc90494c8bf [Sclerotinia trifoliorum]|uniref:DNA polymerase epsilon subunit B n=1 Tax=Sclerotinia trifoliorum TaxID=28548 RepID=A0A8H2VU15_9HELO|nr:1fbbef25-f6ec-472a-97bc-7fc90494c8bf [Sclerotinia trifoliorum]
MSRPNPIPKSNAASIFRPPATPTTNLNPIPSSSPAFATPVHPIRPFNAGAVPIPKTSILPILLPPATLRPLAFRTFTKKHSLTLTSSALQVLATFIGKHCGTGWREEGLAERVLEEVAKSWKNRSGGVIVDGEGTELKEILKALEGNMSGGRIVVGRELSRQNSLVLGSSQHGEVNHTRLGLRPGNVQREDSQSSLGMSMLEVDDEEGEDGLRDPRRWLKVIDAFEQPRLIYNVAKKHFDRDTSKPSLFPPASHKTLLFQNRYNIIHQRLLRNESFQTPAFQGGKASLQRSISAIATPQQSYKLTPIANLLGRNRSIHMLLGLLSISPTGTLAINDLTGTIALDLTHAKAVPEDGAWFVPGMIVLVDGTYEEDETGSSSRLGGNGGVGGTISGKFIGFTIGHPPPERRHVTLGTAGKGDTTAGGGFGWVDFLGVGSSRALGNKMQRLEQKLLRPPPHSSDTDDIPLPSKGRVVILGEVHLDIPQTLQALKKILSLYSSEPEGCTPMTFILLGSFVSHAVLSRGGSGGSIEYKEYFDSLAAVLSEYPTLLSTATFIFIPGPNDAWVSAFSSGSSVPLPRKPVPEMFTSRIKRAFASANTETEKEKGKRGDGDAIWTSNPARVSLFGMSCEIVVFRDDISGRLRRTAVTLNSSKNPTAENDEDEDIDMSPPPPPSSPPSSTPPPEIDPDIYAARRLTKTLLDQGHLSPFPLNIAPQHWDFSNALSIYPLPTAIIICDVDSPSFCLTYEGCHVMNPGSVVARGRRGMARWIEYDVWGRMGKVREVVF